MKFINALIFVCLFTTAGYSAVVTGSFKINGDANTFYPVAFSDGAWDSNVPTELFLGRSSVHTDASWLGALNSKFTFHVSSGGHQANFINVDIKQSYATFIAGWRDVTSRNNGRNILIWLKGGVTYFYTSNYAVSPVVYDGVANPLVYNEISDNDPNGINHTFKTTVDAYVNPQGISYGNEAYYNGLGTSYFRGNMGLGVTDTRGYKLAVNGNIRAKEIKVENANWPDYVFEKSYELPTLLETAQHIKEKGHLPGIPSAAEVKANGIDLGEMNAKLLQKIEEITLHLIAENKLNAENQHKLKEQENEIKLLSERLKKLEKQ